MISQGQDLEKQLAAEAKAMPIWQLRAVREGVIRTCLNCENWIPNSDSQKDGGCLIAQGQLPPPVVIVYGCDGWMFDIPF